ncbi:TPA: hypothetical protein QCH65_001613 [Enterobacter roggenkampii]|nr:hypothetical protein [Enterobacter roggenkampii]
MYIGMCRHRRNKEHVHMSEIKNLKSRVKLTEDTLKVGPRRTFAVQHAGKIMEIYQAEFSAIKTRLARCSYHPKKDTVMSDIDLVLTRIKCAIESNNNPTPDDTAHHFALAPGYKDSKA